ncbi:fibronectin type III domain-containing protein, partial [Flavobacterium sp.]|uniref:fibronectin type III domain-containing protein n=1 Tax=Flavobacterium sp. TaxID=239 RepID=UPI002FD99851
NWRPTYSSSTTNIPFINFQIRLVETSNLVKIVYGPSGFAIGSTAVSGTRQIGLRGATNTDFNNRLNAAGLAFGSSTAGTANTSTQAWNTTATPPGMPANGLTYTYSPPLCVTPGGLTLSTVTSTSLSYSWNASSPLPSGGYDYELRTSGAAGSGITGLIASGNTASTAQTFNSLTPQTTYSLYVRSNCGIDGNSNWSSALVGFTGYCVVSTTGQASWINIFNTTGGSTNIAHSAASGASGGYLNLSATEKVSSYVGSTINLAMTAGGPTCGFAVWVDWNDNLIFDASERMFVTSGYVTSTTGSFVVPSASLGNHRMRVVTNYNNSAPSNPCEVFTRGEYKDFNFEVVAPPSCTPPTALASSAITNTTATVSWTAASPTPTNGYDYVLATTSTPVPDGLTVPTATVASGNSVNLTLLTGNTTYYIWVRSNCGASDKSTWTGPISFKTLCDPISTFPWNESFEGVSTGTTVVGTSTNLPDCWNSQSTKYSSSSDVTYNTARTGTKYLRYSWSTTDAYIWSPAFQLTGGVSYDFSFYGQGDGFTGWNNDIYVNTSVNSVGATQLTPTYTATGSGTIAIQSYSKVTRTFVPSTSGVYYFAIRGNQASSTPWYMAFDDFSLDVTPACPSPSALSATTTDTTASLGWNQAGSVSQWDIEYGTNGFTPTGTPTVTGTSSNPYLVTGLVTNTTYQYYVRANCGATMSAWSGPFTFSTQLVAPAPYSEGFANTTLPIGWSNNSMTLGSSTGAGGNPGNTIYKNLWSSATTGNFSIINIGPISSGQELTFDYRLADYDSPYNPPAASSGNYVVEISTNYGATYTTLQTVTNDGVAGWRTKTYSLTSYVGQTIKLRITGNWSSGDYYLAFDNFKVDAPCSSAVGGTLASTSSSFCPGGTATISSTGYSTGSGTTYQWESSTDIGFTIPVAIGSPSGSYANLSTGVLNTTTYYRLKVVCSAGSPSYSNVIGITVFTPATITASTDNTNFCVGGSANISASGASSYTWTSAPAGFTSTSASNVVSPTVTTTYSVVGVDANGCTTNTVNVPVTILLTPSPVTVTSSASPVCVDTIVHLTKTGGTVTSSGNVSIGTQTTTEFGGGVYRGGFGTGDFRHQLLFTQAELNAAGITASNLTSIAFNVTSVGSGAMNNYQIKLASVPTTALTSTFDTASFTTVYNAATYSAVSGVNLHTFDTPFAWNGTSNVIVEICYNVSSIGGSSTLAATTPAVISNTNLLGSVGACTALTGSTYANRPLATFGYNIPVAVTTSWTSSPASTLYTDAAASIAYTPGADAASVYAKPTVQTTYTATATNGTCSSAPASVVVDVNPLPVFSIAPTTICSSDTATLTVATSESNSYSWTPVGGGTTITGATVMVSPTVTTTYNVTATSNTTVPACQKTNQVTVTVNEKGTIVSGTTSRTVSAGQPTTFVVNTTGSGLSYQWQVNDGSGWVNLSNDYVDEFTGNYLGVTTATLSVQNIDGGFDGYQYQCLVTGQAPCATLTPIVATLTVSNTGFATQPADVNLCGTTSTSFTIVTTGDEPFFVQWQMSTDGGVSYVDITDGFDAGTGLTFAGANDLSPKTLSVSGITPTNDGLKFKAQLDFFTESNVATLTVNTPVSFDTNVSTTPINVCQGVTSNNLSFVASGSIASIKWKYATSAGGTYTDVVNGTPLGATYSNDTTQTLTVATTAATPVGAYYYKAFLVGAGAGPNKCPDVESNVATLMVNKPTVAIAASQTSYCTPGAAVTLTASGASTYSWSSVPTGFTSSSAAISVTPSESTSYTVIGTDGFGCTNTATQLINVGASFTVTSANANGVQCPGDVVNLSSIVTPAGGVVYNIATGANSRNYSFTAVAGTFTPLVGATPAPGIITTSDDDVSTNITPGFTFNYGGTNYTDLRVSSNGHLIFGTSGTSSLTNDLATSTSAQRPGLAPLWDDLQCTAGISYLVSGTAPNRVLTIEWLNMEWNYASNTAVVSYQVKLYETTNVIEYVYRQDATAVNSGSASIGLMGTASANFMSLSDSSASPSISTSSSTNTIGVKPATGQVYRFTPSLPITYSYAWSSTPSGFTSTIANPTATPSVATTYNLAVTSSQGCVANAAPLAVNVQNTAPVISTQPIAQAKCVGQNVTFTVVSSSTSALTYQWRKDGSPLTNGTGIAGATSASLTLTGVTLASDGLYDVVVTT